MANRDREAREGGEQVAAGSAAMDRLDVGDLPVVGAGPPPEDPDPPTLEAVPPEDAPTMVRSLVDLGLAPSDGGAESEQERPAQPAVVAVQGTQGAPSAGEFIGGAKLVELIAAGQKVSCWRGQQADRTTVTVHVLAPGASDRESKVFMRGASRMGSISREHPLRGVAKVLKVVPGVGVYITDLAAAGTMDDLPMLNWGLPEKVAFVRRVCAALGAVHASGHTHGCLRPANVLLDEELQPVLSDVGTVDVHDSFPGKASGDNDYAPYAAPEVRKGAPTSVRSDVYGAGRLLYFLLHGSHPADPDADIPALDRLVDVAPEGLVRIVRRCTTVDPTMRYAGVEELLGDIAKFKSADGVGLPPPAGEASPVAAARPAPKPQPARAPDESVRAPAAARSLPDAQRRLAAAQARAPSEVVAKRASAAGPADGDIATGRQRAVVVAFGLALLGAGLGLTFLTGIESVLAASAQLVGAVALSAMVPAIGGWPRGSRVAWAAACAAAVALAAPGTHAARAGRVAKLRRGSSQARAAAIVSLRSRGLVEFVDLDLSGADLSGLDLAFLVFDRSRLVNAKLTGTRLSDSSFIDADLTGADISGANLEGIDVARITGWDRVTCSAETRMPTEWLCPDGVPVSTRGLEEPPMGEGSPAAATGAAARTAPPPDR